MGSARRSTAAKAARTRSRTHHFSRLALGAAVILALAAAAPRDATAQTGPDGLGRSATPGAICAFQPMLPDKRLSLCSRLVDRPNISDAERALGQYGL